MDCSDGTLKIFFIHYQDIDFTHITLFNYDLLYNNVLIKSIGSILIPSYHTIPIYIYLCLSRPSGWIGWMGWDGMARINS